jgi:hypothetical protein
MKKKVEPKPTKVSRHNAPYTFQQRSINLHPLSGLGAQNVKQYQPNSYIMGHSSVLSMSASQPIFQSRTYTPHGGVFENSATTSGYESLQTDSVGSNGDGGLSTDGHEIYDIENGFVPEPMPDETELAAKQAVNNNRTKMVKSAPAKFPSDGRRISIADFAKEVVELDKPAHLQNLEDDADLQWLMSATPSPLDTTMPLPTRARSAHPTMVSELTVLMIPIFF